MSKKDIMDKYVPADLRLWRMVHFMSESAQPPTIKDGLKYYKMCYDFLKHPEREKAVNDAIRGRLGDRLVKIRRCRGDFKGYFIAIIRYLEQ